VKTKTKRPEARFDEEHRTMKSALAAKPKRSKKQTAPRRSSSSEMPCSDAELKKDGLTEDESWGRDMATLREFAAELALRRNESGKLVRKRDVEVPVEHIVESIEDPSATVRRIPIQHTVESLEDPSAAVRNLSVRALYDLDPGRAASLFNIALREGSLEERRKIGAALAASGVVDEAINNLMEGNCENCYGEFSLLFLVAKAGEVQPLIRLIEKHPNMDLRLAVVTLLASSGGPEVLSAFRRLALNGSLAGGVQLALLEAINQITSPTTKTTSSAA